MVEPRPHEGLHPQHHPLLVGQGGQAQGAREPAEGPLHRQHGSDEGGQAPLHVAGPPAVEPAPFHHGPVGRVAPEALVPRGDHVGVPLEDEPPFPLP
jgi:hypothetical protein